MIIDRTGPVCISPFSAKHGQWFVFYHFRRHAAGHLCFYNFWWSRSPDHRKVQITGRVLSKMARCKMLELCDFGFIFDFCWWFLVHASGLRFVFAVFQILFGARFGNTCCFRNFPKSVWRWGHGRTGWRGWDGLLNTTSAKSILRCWQECGVSEECN